MDGPSIPKNIYSYPFAKKSWNISWQIFTLTCSHFSFNFFFAQSAPVGYLNSTKIKLLKEIVQMLLRFLILPKNPEEKATYPSCCFISTISPKHIKTVLTSSKLNCSFFPLVNTKVRNSNGVAIYTVIG